MNYKNSVCKGSKFLGTNCGICERCVEVSEHKNKSVENKFYKWFENFLSSKPEEYSDEMLKSYQAGHNSRDEEFEYLKREVHVACAFLTWYDEYAAKAILVRIKEKYEQTD